MKFTKLAEYREKTLRRGTLFKFSAGHPFEDQVVMMVCGAPDSEASLAAASLMAIACNKEGINCFVIFTEESRENGLSVYRIINNWKTWIWPDGDINDVWVRPPLDVSELG